MNSKVKPKIIELLSLLSNEEAEENEIQEMTPALELALTNPKAYFEENPENEWLAQGNDLDELPPRIAQDLFAWTLGAVLQDFAITGDKGDEMAEAVIEVLQDYDLEIEDPGLGNWFQYEAFFEKALIKAKSEVKLITLDISFSDEATIFLVPRKKFDQVVELLRFFAVKRIEG